jgi:arylsulfatase A-like enzyme
MPDLALRARSAARAARRRSSGLQGQGLRFNRFHTTALCSPTRQALLTGRNHHAVGMGGITEIATSAPGYNSIRPASAAPLAEMMKLNGYSTAQLGKCHEVPVWETSPMGPFNQWPLGSGFEYFYGFVGAETNQYVPALYDGVAAIEPPRTPEQGYHLTEDLADKAIAWVGQQKSLMPDKPFFMYFAPGATHAPHHVPKEWSARYRGRFDQGWDAIREETLTRQKELGVVPAEAELTARHAEISAWQDVPEELKPVLTRQMKIYAGFLELTDHHVGRLIDTLEGLGVLDDTLIYLIIGDNGASAEGTPNGSFNEIISLNGAAEFETTEFMTAHIDARSGPRRRITITRSAGHMRWTPRSSGRSRSPRTGEVPATGRSCTGPTGSARAASCAASSTTSLTWPRPSLRWQACPSPRS